MNQPISSLYDNHPKIDKAIYEAYLSAYQQLFIRVALIFLIKLVYPILILAIQYDDMPDGITLVTVFINLIVDGLFFFTILWTVSEYFSISPNLQKIRDYARKTHRLVYEEIAQNYEDIKCCVSDTIYDIKYKNTHENHLPIPNDKKKYSKKIAKNELVKILKEEISCFSFFKALYIFFHFVTFLLSIISLSVDDEIDGFTMSYLIVYIILTSGEHLDNIYYFVVFKMRQLSSHFHLRRRGNQMYPHYNITRATYQNLIAACGSCKICGEPMQEDNQIYTLNCSHRTKHIFHADCMKIRANYSSKCPTCNKIFFVRNYLN